MMATLMFWNMEHNIEQLATLTYGIAPIPKFSKTQEYRSYVQDQVSSFGISAGVGGDDRRRSWHAVLEAMAYHSYNIVRPAYYTNTLSTRYMQDPQSEEILNLIFKSLSFDFSQTCSNILSGSCLRDMMRPIMSGNRNTVSSHAELGQKCAEETAENQRGSGEKWTVTDGISIIRHRDTSQRERQQRAATGRHAWRDADPLPSLCAAGGKLWEGKQKIPAARARRAVTAAVMIVALGSCRRGVRGNRDAPGVGDALPVPHADRMAVPRLRHDARGRCLAPAGYPDGVCLQRAVPGVRCLLRLADGFDRAAVYPCRESHASGTPGRGAYHTAGACTGLWRTAEYPLKRVSPEPLFPQLQDAETHPVFCFAGLGDDAVLILGQPDRYKGILGRACPGGRRRHTQRRKQDAPPVVSRRLPMSMRRDRYRPAGSVQSAYLRRGYVSSPNSTVTVPDRSSRPAAAMTASAAVRMASRLSSIRAAAVARSGQSRSSGVVISSTASRTVSLSA